MHSDQIDIKAAHVSALIADQFPQFRGEEIVELATTGTVNVVFRIGAKHAARFPLQMMDTDECTRLLGAEAQASAEFN